MLRYFFDKPGGANDMKSDHIDNRKLYEIVTMDAVLEQAAVEHLKTCDECLEMIRVLVRQTIPNPLNP